MNEYETLALLNGSLAKAEALRDEAIDLLCQMSLGVDMGTSAPVSEALREALVTRYKEREPEEPMTREEWRWVIDAELPVFPEPRP